MTRNNPADNFEACYLRENPSRKAFANVTAVNELLADEEFEKCVKHVTNLTFVKNREVLTKHGFDFEDMLNVVRVFGLQFVNNKFEGKTKRDVYYVMMHAMNQRLNNFYRFLNRKFHISEKYPEINLEDFGGTAHPDPEDMTSAHEVDAETGYMESEWARDAKKDALKALLEENIDDYREKLAELATSKMTEYTVRKKARAICRKHKIDYVAWAREQIRKRDLNVHDFVLE